MIPFFAFCLIIALLGFYINAIVKSNMKYRNSLDRERRVRQVTMEVLWSHVIPNQQMPYADMEALIERLAFEPDASVRRVLEKALLAEKYK